MKTISCFSSDGETQVQGDRFAAVSSNLFYCTERNQREENFFVFLYLYSYIWSGARSLKHHRRTTSMRFHQRSDEIQLQ